MSSCPLFCIDFGDWFLRTGKKLPAHPSEHFRSVSTFIFSTFIFCTILTRSHFLKASNFLVPLLCHILFIRFLSLNASPFGSDLPSSPSFPWCSLTQPPSFRFPLLFLASSLPVFPPLSPSFIPFTYYSPFTLSGFELHSTLYIIYFLVYGLWSFLTFGYIEILMKK